MRKLPFRQLYQSEFCRYAMTGVLNTAVCSVSMSLFALIGMPYTIYTALGYGVAFLNSYVLNGLWTFKYDRLGAAHFLYYAGFNLVGLLCSEAAQMYLIEIRRLPELPSVACGMVVFTVTMFLLNRRFVFRRERQERE